jgi:GNAT superfamily N-acetyltransferase
MEKLIIREAQKEDIPRMAILCNQLGYPTKMEDLPIRLDMIRDLSHHIVIIAELDHLVVGWLHAYLCPLLITGSQAQLGGMVVDDEFRSLGIGKELLLHAEDWARTKGCKFLTVFSNITRSATHNFYGTLDYSNIKTELVLQKEL